MAVFVRVGYYVKASPGGIHNVAVGKRNTGQHPKPPTSPNLGQSQKETFRCIEINAFFPSKFLTNTSIFKQSILSTNCAYSFKNIYILS